MFKPITLLCVLSCATVPNTTVSTTESRNRTVLQQFDSAVAIQILCASEGKLKAGALGSGVILTDSRMVTAYHVVDEKNCAYVAVSRDQVKHFMTLRNESEELDLAEFTVSPPFAPTLVSNFEFADATTVGERLCVATLFPQSSRFCGERSPNTFEAGMDVEWFGVVQPGNSGSGVYNERGQLVAIVTRVRVCTNGQYCFAYGSSIRKAPWW